MKTARQRAFTLMEVIIVVAIVGVMAAIAVPLFSRTQKKGELRSAASQMVSDFRRARSLAKTGSSIVPTWPPNTRAIQAGIRIDSTTSYTIIVDSDNTVGNAPTDAAVEVVNLPTRYQGQTFAITSPPPGTEIRFKKNGTLTTSADASLVLTDTDGGATRTITVTYGGNASFL